MAKLITAERFPLLNALGDTIQCYISTLRIICISYGKGLG